VRGCFENQLITELAKLKYLGLGKCQSVDFDAQTASTSIVMLEYSLLSLAKKELEYQTIGGIFKDIQKDTQTPTLDERILLIIRELVFDLAEILEIPFEELITKIISENDARVVNLSLTEKGKELYTIFVKIYQKELSKILKEVSEEKILITIETILEISKIIKNQKINLINKC